MCQPGRTATAKSKLMTVCTESTSGVAKRKAQERDYQVLADLNYRPRTTYTAGVINPNPELA